MSAQLSLHPSPFLASLQLLFWLLFYPSAWRQYVQGIDPSLPPDFALYRLNKAQWSHPDLQYLTGVIHLAAPLGVGALVFFSLWFMTGGSLFQDTGHLAIRGLIYSSVLSLAVSLTGSILVSVAFGAVAGMLGGLLTGLFFTDNPDFWPELAILGGIFAASVACSVLWGLAAPRSGRKSPAKLKLFAGLLAGGLIPAAILTVCVIVVPWLLNRLPTPYFDDPYTFGLALGIGGILYFYLHSKLWPGIVAGAFFAVISSFVKSSGDIHADDSFWLGGVFKPFIGGLSNGLVFMLLFSLSYLVTRQFTASPRAGIFAGLLGSCGIYLVLFLFSGNSDPWIVPLAFVAAGAGFSQRWWFSFRKADDEAVPSFERDARKDRGLIRKFIAVTEKMVGALRQRVDTARRQLAHEAEQLADFAAPVDQIPNRYVLGNPLITSEQQKLFVGRKNVAREIQHYFSRGISVFLYGQRRVGKTSLLYHLSHFLNEHEGERPQFSLFFWLKRIFHGSHPAEKYLVTVIDLQGLSVEADDDAGLFRSFSRNIQKSAKKTMGKELPSLTIRNLEGLSEFDEWLDEAEAMMPNVTLVLVLDEFEALAGAFADRRLHKDAVLSRLRNIIQHRSRCKVVFAGSHLLENYPDWMSYLNNMVTVSVGYLTESEACTLIERPYKPFPLRYEPGVVPHMLTLTGRHPAFLQALCSEIINLLNEQNEQRPDASPCYTVRVEDVEAALPRAWERTSFIFSHLFTVSGEEKPLLHLIAGQGKNAVINRETLRGAFPLLAPDRLLESLAERGILESLSSGYRFRLEFIRRYYLADNIRDNTPLIAELSELQTPSGGDNSETTKYAKYTKKTGLRLQPFVIPGDPRIKPDVTL